MAKKVEVIITTFNDIGKIKVCLDSVSKQTYKGLQVYIVDDFSKDGTVEYIKKHYKKFKVESIGLGPSQNRNVALKHSSGEYIITMDSDASLVSNKWIENAVKFMEKNRSVGMMGGKLLIDDKTINSAGGVMSKRGNGYDLGHGDSAEKTEYNNLRRVIYVSTATSIIRRKMLDEIGLFDGDYGHGFEDTDLGFRATLAGWPVIYNPLFISYHYAKYFDPTKGAINSSKNYFLKRNKLTTLLKNYEIRTLAIYFPLLFLNFVYSLIFQKFRESTLRAYFWNISHVREILKKRQAIQATRKISDAEIFKQIHFRL